MSVEGLQNILGYQRMVYARIFVFVQLRELLRSYVDHLIKPVHNQEYGELLSG